MSGPEKEDAAQSQAASEERQRESENESKASTFVPGRCEGLQMNRTEPPELRAVENDPPPPGWPPPLDSAALHGLAGDIVREIGPHTEADPAALLTQYLVAFGSALGSGPHFMAEADQHRGNLFMAIVGTSAKGRKGASYGYIKRIFAAADEPWAKARVMEWPLLGRGPDLGRARSNRKTRTHSRGQQTRR